MYPASRAGSMDALSPSALPVLLNRNPNVYGVGSDRGMTPSLYDLSTPLAAGPRDAAYPFPHLANGDRSSPRIQMSSVPLSPGSGPTPTFTPMDAIGPLDPSRSAPTHDLASTTPRAPEVHRGSLYPITEVDSSRRTSGNESIDSSPSVGVALGTPSILQHSPGTTPGVSPYWDGPFIFTRPNSNVTSTSPAVEAPARLSQGAHPTLATVQIYPSRSEVHPLKRELSFSSCLSHWSSTSGGNSPPAALTTSPESGFQPPGRNSSLQPTGSERDSWVDVSSSTTPSVVADVIDTPVIERTLGGGLSPKHPSFLPIPATPYLPAERDSPATPRPLTVGRASLLPYSRPEEDGTELDYDDSRFAGPEADPFSDRQAVVAVEEDAAVEHDATPTGSPGSSQAEAPSSRASAIGSDEDETLRVRSQLRKMSLALDETEEEDLQKTVFSFPITPMPMPTPAERPSHMGGGFPGLTRVPTSSSAYSSATGMTTSSNSLSPIRPSLGRPTLSKRASSFMSSSATSPMKKRPSLHDRKHSSISFVGKHSRRPHHHETEWERSERERMASVRRRIRTAANQLEMAGSPGTGTGTSKMGLTMQASRSR